MMKYKIQNNEYNVEIIRKKNKNTYIRVKPDLTIYVTTNYLVTNMQINKLLKSNNSFLDKEISRLSNKIETNDTFLYQGVVYDIIVMPSNRVNFIDNRVYITDRKQLDKWLKKETKIIFNKHVESMYKLFDKDIEFPIIKIRKMKTRWGVCNKRDNSITLNSELSKYSLDKLDYVIIHELSHFIHFNHSKDFWDLVSNYCPNYKKTRKELKG